MSKLFDTGGIHPTSSDDFENLTWAALTVKPIVSHLSTSIKIRLHRHGTGGGTLTVSLRAVNPADHKPTGGDLVAAPPIAAASITTDSGGQLVEFTWTTPYQLDTLTEYAIVARTSSGDGSNFLEWHQSNPTSWSRGYGWRSTNGGSTWTTMVDWGIELYGEGPLFAIAAPSDIQITQITGSATLDDNTDLDGYGFDIRSLVGNYTLESVEVMSQPSTGTFGATVLELEESKWYYIRPKVHHSSLGWIYGGWETEGEYQFQTDNDNSLLVYDNYAGAYVSRYLNYTTSRWTAHIILTPISYLMRGVRLNLFKFGSPPSGIITVGIRAVDGSNKPTGADLLVGYMPTSVLTTTPTNYYIGFGSEGLVLNSGTHYAIVLRYNTGGISNSVAWSYGSYTGAGYSCYSTDGGVTWTTPTISRPMLYQALGESGVLTNPASEIGSIQAVGNGFLLDTNNVDELGFEWGTVQGGPYPDDVTDTTTPFFPGDYSLLMTGLSGSTVYYYRAKVHDTVLGWLYGDEETFETLPPTPVVQTDPPDTIVVGEATASMNGNGNILSIGAENADVRGFVYGQVSQSQPDYSTAPGLSGYDSYVSESGSFGVGVFSLAITGLSPNKKYFIRAFAHNSYGYHYGQQLIVYVSDTISILYPSGTFSEGIRFNTSPGGHYPKIGTKSIPDYVLCRNEDSQWFDNVRWGYITGQYAYERHYYNSNMYTDLFTLTNPHIRVEGIIKAKWRATFNKNSYPFGQWQRHLVTHSVQYDGSVGDIVRDPDTNNDRRCEVFYTNPNTGAAWTVDELDNLVAGASVGNEASYGIAVLDYLVVIACWANGESRTDPATPISDTSSQLNGYVVEDEGEEVEVYFEWGLTDAYGNETTHETGKFRGEYFSAVVTGLTPGATYHCRAVLVTLCGETFYGEDRTFPFLSYPGIWLGTGPTDRFLMEITDHVLGYRTEQGRDEELGHAASGIAELTCDNWDGRFSPEKTDGEYYGYLYIGAYLTIIETYGGTLYYRFSGKIDKISPHPEPDNRVGYIVAIDGMDDLAGSEIETVLRTDTDEQELLGDILDAAGWLAGMRDLDAGVDTLQLGWFHEEMALPAVNSLEDATRGFFFVDPEGNATWQNRHYRVIGDRLVSQYTFDENMIEVQYEWSKRDVKNWARVTGYKYVDPYYGLPSEEWLWYAPANSEAAPFIPANSTITIWASLQGPRKSSDALVEGTHWNANSEYDKSGDDLSANITVTPTYYGQAIKFVIENAGSSGAYLVVPDSPPVGAPDDATLLVYGTIYEELVMTVVEEDTTSQDDYGKRTMSIDARFKSNYNDILAYAEWLIAGYKDPLPSPIRIRVNPWYALPDDSLKIYTLTLKISDRVTVVSSHLGISQDYFIDKIIHEYAVNEGSWVETAEYWLSRTEGQSEGLYWILGVAGFTELGQTTRLGF